MGNWCNFTKCFTKE